jgi:hypothetical protein
MTVTQPPPYPETDEEAFAVISSNRTDIHDRVTNQIIRAFEAGTCPWVRLWDSGKGFQTPRASRHSSSRRSGRSHGSPPPNAGRNNAGINQAARGVVAARPGRGPRRGTAPEGKPSRLRWTEVTLPVLRPVPRPHAGAILPSLVEAVCLQRRSPHLHDGAASRRSAL